MEYISSDTNVWIDFSVICRTELPFRLPYTYIMNSDAIEDELLSPDGLCEELKNCGLVSVEITIEEFTLADGYGSKYPQLSIYDRIALAIAKSRSIFLLTGDGNLRKAAKNEAVSIIGTIGIIDQLLDSEHITIDEYEYCLIELQKNNGSKVRLPKSEINSRLQRIKLYTRDKQT
jgi:predicted nucleic acid-binding protein